MSDDTVKPDQGDDPELFARIADEIVEALRKAYASDQNVDKAYDITWHKYKAQGVRWETFLAARDLARPRLDELFKAYIEQLSEAARERFHNLDLYWRDLLDRVTIEPHD
jgi:hypothetical protein